MYHKVIIILFVPSHDIKNWQDFIIGDGKDVGRERQRWKD
jgi:hypothetical protein